MGLAQFDRASGSLGTEYTRIERGVRGASIDLISLLSGYFNTTIDFLVDGKAVEECSNLLQGLDEIKKAKVIAIMKCVIENI